jgi:transposase
MRRLGRGHGRRIRVFFMDEARFGQQGTLARVWAQRGSRPTAVKQTKYEWVYLYAAVEPATGASTALLAPHVNTGTMSVFLRMLSEDLGPRDHAVVIMDQAGWHVSKRLAMPANVTAWLLPPYSPELNPVENLWHWIKSHHTSNRAFRDYEHLLEAVGEAWRSLTKKRLRSVCRCHYLTPGYSA